MEVRALEIAAGHDGFLRGKPDPALLIGAFFVTAAEPRVVKPLGRMLVRFAPRGRLPLTVAPPLPSVLKARARGVDGDRLVLLAIALEEDAGTDVARLFARLEDGARLRLWATDAPEPSPAGIGELVGGAASAPPFATRVNVIDDSQDLRDGCKADELVGAGMVVIAPHRSEDSYRVHFLADDRKNDWTAELVVKTSG
ncbi:MAG: hypothetical protein HY898_23920 [Deltaproteobacteria bacterium]|nr:hypothetical protein [Deltaproteobacteria bacterium]